MSIMNRSTAKLGQLIKQQRVTVPLTLQELAVSAGVSSSHLGRIERGERFPSAQILRKIARPLGFAEDELFTLAGFLSPSSPSIAEKRQGYTGRGSLDPWVARTLAQEPVEAQRAAISILGILKTIARSLVQEEHPPKSDDAQPTRE